MRLLREPLLHFVVLGGLFFVAQHWTATSTRRIDLSPTLIAGLRQDQFRRSGTQPTAAEENALIQRYIDSEVLYREALALGLDRGDIIVRRRLEQKMEFVLENRNAPADPSDSDLQAFLESHQERYASPARLSFTQVFVSNDRHPDTAESVALDLRNKLIAGTGPDTLGDPFLHGSVFKSRSPSEIAALFGEVFARQTAQLPLDVWSQPIQSTYGWHVVRVENRTAPALPPLSSVHERVLQDWDEEQRGKALETGLAELRQRYTVRRSDQ